MSITTPQLVLRMPHDEYLADPVEGGSLSSTGAKQILAAPAKFRHLQAHPETSKDYDLGHAVHSAVLGFGPGAVEIPESVLSRNGTTGTDAARAFIAEARAEGKIPMKRGELWVVRQMTEAVLGHPTAKALLEQPGNPEVSIFGRDAVTGEWMRARPDLLPTPDPAHRPIVVDLKTAESADPRQFRRAAATYGYHQQHAWYLDTLAAVRDDYADAALVFVVVEKEAPWLVSVCELDAEAVQRGRERNRAALDLWHRCRQTGLWPGYGDEVHRINLPMWALSEEETVL